MPRETPLVLEHLEDISWRVMEEYPEIVKELIRGRAGIYALYRRDRLYYVGLARNLMGRLKTHLKDRHHGAWDRFSVYLTVHDEHMKELESMVLRITAPTGNKAGGKFAKSVNLRLKLLNSMREFDADRRARLLGGRIAEQRRRVKTKRAQGSTPLAGVVERGIVLAAHHTGKRYRAMLRRDGTIRYGNRVYRSPTGAAFAATRKTVNGWNFWRYKKGSKWVPLGEIRG